MFDTKTMAAPWMRISRSRQLYFDSYGFLFASQTRVFAYRWESCPIVMDSDRWSSAAGAIYIIDCGFGYLRRLGSSSLQRLDINRGSGSKEATGGASSGIVIIGTIDALRGDDASQ